MTETPEANPSEHSFHSAATKFALRIITYAWGEKYVDDLLSLALPAILAPGNLPYLTSQTECELVVLTEEHFFPKFCTAPAISRIRKLCPIRFIGLDDLIAAPGRYGMSLTYALHRGFSDLGPAMTETFLFFLNADFVVADGSFRSLYEQLMRGERIVASPSYCVIAGDILPELHRRVEPHAGVLSIPPREMVALILKNRHETIRGKTVNQKDHSMFYMDQFYWEVDENTLIGHQMPVAIVGMRPERYVPEPNSYWDHGLMEELCPHAPVKVLGDSDDFLMLELRDKSVAREQIVSGWPKPIELANRMLLWLTSYQRAFVQEPLTLHASELPASLPQARASLRAFVEEVMSYTPAKLPPHIGHSQWNYHWLPFMEARHKYLSDRLGPLTEMAPPSSLSEVDKAWWQLDGLQKVYSRRRAEMFHRFFRESPMPDLQIGSRAAEVYPSLILEKYNDADMLTLLASAAAQGSALSADGVQKKTALDPPQGEPDGVSTLFLEQMRLLDLEFGTALHDLNKTYERLTRKRQPEDQLHIKDKEAPRAATLDLFVDTVRLVLKLDVAGTWLAFRRLIISIVRRAYHKVYGRFPHITMLSPYWATLRPLVHVLDRAVASGADDVLIVGDHSKLGVSIRTPGQLIGVSSAGVLAEDFSQVISRWTEFDLCVCDLSFTELSDFSDFYRAVRPHMRSGGTIIGFHLNVDVVPLPLYSKVLTNILQDAPTTVVHYAGSARIARVLQAYRRARGSGSQSTLAVIRRMAMKLPWLTFRALFANVIERTASPDSTLISSEYCTSITIEISVPRIVRD